MSTGIAGLEAARVAAIRGHQVVMAVGSRKNILDVEGINVSVYYAGDCSGEQTAGITEAIRSGYNAANEI